MPDRIVTIYRLFMLILIACVVTSCDNGTQATINETWTLAELITKGERTDTITDIVEVRNCGVAERKSVTCSAGTSNELTVSLGGSVGAQAGFEGTIDASVSAGLGLERDSGQTLDLDLPPDGFVYLYTVNKRYSTLTGEVLARSTANNERKVTYAFHANCSLHIESREILTCQGGEPPLTQIPPAEPATANSDCQETIGILPNSPQEIKAKFGIPADKGIRIFYEICQEAPNGFIVEDTPSLFTLQVPPGGCIDSYSGARFSDATVPEQLFGGRRAYSGSVTTTSLTYRIAGCELKP